jgi:hypothetical protein
MMAAGRTGGNLASLDQGHLEPAQCQVMSQGAACAPPAYYQNVKLFHPIPRFQDNKNQGSGTRQQ